jgi:hypothetical protein
MRPVSQPIRFWAAMSALGQKQTYAMQHGMSALLPIATVKADSRKRSCLLYPESGHVQRTSGCPLWAKSGHGTVPQGPIFVVWRPGFLLSVDS